MRERVFVGVCVEGYTVLSPLFLVECTGVIVALLIFLERVSSIS